MGNRGLDVMVKSMSVLEPLLIDLSSPKPSSSGSETAVDAVVMEEQPLQLLAPIEFRMKEETSRGQGGSYDDKRLARRRSAGGVAGT